MRNILHLGLRLLIITVAAGLLLGAAQYITSDPIAKQQALKLEQSRQTVFPDVAYEKVDEALVQQVKDSDPDHRFDSFDEVYYAMDGGQVVGCTMTVAGKGYGGDIVIMVGVKTDGTITGISISSHSETPGLGAKSTEESFSGQFAGALAPLKVVKTQAQQEDEISAITGATITSTAVVDAVNLSGEFAANLFDRGQVS